MHLDRDATNRLGRFRDHPSPARADANSDRSRPGWAEPQAMALNWERLTRTAMHPVKIAVLEQLAHGEASPRELADRLGQPIATVSYHVRRLRDTASSSPLARASAAARSSTS